MDDRNRPDPLAAAASRALSIEILVHLLLLFAVILPLAFLVYPYFVYELGVGLVNRNLADDWQHRGNTAAHRSLDDPEFLTQQQEILTGLALTVFTVMAAARSYRTSRKSAFNSKDRRFRRLVGLRGDALRQRVTALWSGLANQKERPPTVMWFSNSSVSACATRYEGEPTIAVSIGLWERSEAADPLSELILLHELAHLAYNDPIRLARFHALLETTKRIWHILVRVLSGVLAFMIAHSAYAGWRDHRSVMTILALECMLLLIGMVVMLVGPAAVSIVRRYFGMITSLIELRADVRAAQWAGGLKTFLDATLTHPLVHHSDYADRARSLFSFRLTHLSETERVELFARPQSLLLPKFKYFLFSLFLAVFMTLNIYTSMIGGGIFDLAILEAVAIAMVVASVAMLVNAAAAPVKLHARSLTELAAAVVLCTAACHFWLDTVTYSVATVAVTIGNPAAVGPFSIASTIDVMVASGRDIGRELSALWSHGWIFVSMVVVVFLFRLLYGIARWIPREDRLRLFVTGLAAFAAALGILVEGYDDLHSGFLLTGIPDTIESGWTTIVSRHPGLRFTLGPLLGLSVVLLSSAAIFVSKQVYRSPQVAEPAE